MAIRPVSPTFVARQPELDHFAVRFGATREGRACVVLLGGEAGVGKSRLVEEAAQRAEGAGGRVLMGSCVELGGEGLALAPLVDVLRTLVRTLQPSVLDHVLGAARAELAQLLPELDSSDAASARGPGSSQPGHAHSDDRTRLFERVLGVLHRVADTQPLMVVFEDIHWADRSTLDLLAFLIRALANCRVLLVATYRVDELHRRHPLRPALAEWERLRQVTTIELQRFDEDAVAAQLCGILGLDPSPQTVRDVYARSGGNAFLTEEALAVAQSGGMVSSSVRSLLLARVEGLSEEAQQLLRLLAAGGHRVAHRTVEAVAGLAPNTLRDALREAVDHAVLTIDHASGGYAFRHALVRDAILEDTLPGELVAFHRAYAEALAADASIAVSPAAAASELAFHWYAAHDLPHALTAAIDAARAAENGYAYAEATQLLLRALEIWPAVPDAAGRSGLDHVRLLELTVDAATRSGDDLDRAHALVSSALSELDPSIAPLRYAVNLRRRSLVTAMRRSVDAVHDLLRAAELIPPEPPSHEGAAVLAQLARAHFWRAEWEPARATAERALHAAEAVGDEASVVDALVTRGSALSYLKRPEEGLASFQSALSIAERTAAVEPLLRCYANLSDCLELVGRHRDAADVAAEGVAAADRLGFSLSWGVFLRANCGESLMNLGELAAAEEMCAGSEPVDANGTFAVSLSLVQSEVALRRGRLDEAERRLEAVRKAGDATGGWQFSLPAGAAAAALALARHDVPGARALLGSLRLDAAAEETPRYLWPVLWLAMRIEADATDLPPANGTGGKESVSNVLQLASILPSDSGPNRMHQLLVEAEHARLLATSDQAQRWLNAADAANDLGNRYEGAYATWRAAEAFAAAGQRDQAATRATEAMSAAAAMGAHGLIDELQALARRARLDLTAQGPAPGRPRDGALSRLTTREIDVLRLLGEGRTNAQIATDLYISTKTASVHVSNILAKLGVATRGEAAALAHRSKLI